MYKSKLIAIITLIFSVTFLFSQEKKVMTKTYTTGSKDAKTVTSSVKGGNTQTHMMKFDGDDVAMLQELRSILVEEKGEALVKFIPPSQAIPKQYQNVDLKTNDKLIFINGKKIKKLDDFKKVYNELKPGDEIELGIKRDDEKFFVKFEKCDPEKLPGKVMMKTEIKK